MQSSRRSAPVIAAVVLLLAVRRWTPAVHGRPSHNTDVQDSDDKLNSTTPVFDQSSSSSNVELDSAFARALRSRLQGLSDDQLVVLESFSSGPSDQQMSPNEDEDVMMGDEACPPDDQQPGAGQTPTDLSSSEKLAEIRLRDKNNRIMEIQKKFLNMFSQHIRGPIPNQMTSSGMMSDPIAAAQRRDAVNILCKDVNNFPISDAITEKTQSFYPSCIRPKNISEVIWNSRESLNLVFDLSNLPKTSNNILMNVTSAKLRLYKHLNLCASQSSNETDDSRYCEPPKPEDMVKLFNSSSEEILPLRMEDKQIRVSIYVFTRKFHKKRYVKKKLLDSRMIPFDGEKWTEWNIRSAAKVWHQEPSHNFGMSVEVEDEDGNVLPAGNFFKPMNCTGNSYTTTPKPIPGFLTEAVDHGYGLQLNPAAANNLTLNALNFNTVHRYPVLDVTTASEPEARRALQYERTRLAYEQGLANASQMSGIMSRPDEQHRTRHHHGNGTSDGQQDVNIGQLNDQIVEKHVIYKNVPKQTPQTTVPPNY